MAEVIAKIEALEAFRSHLIRFNKELAESFASMRAHWRDLGDDWRDDMYRHRLASEQVEKFKPSSKTSLYAYAQTAIRSPA